MLTTYDSLEYLLLYSLRTVRRIPQPHALPAPVPRAGERRGEAAHLVRVRVGLGLGLGFGFGLGLGLGLG